MDIKLIIIIALVTIAIFFILRELFTWYWKINEIVKQQSQQTEILNKILKALTPPEDIEISKEEESEKFDGLNDYENALVKKYVDFGIKKGEKVVINKRSREINRFDQAEWVKINDKEDWSIIIEG